MPVYIFEDDRDGSIHEVIQSMNDEHIAFASDGYKLKRTYSNPRIGVDTKLNPFSSKDFVRATSKSKDNLGSLYDRAREMSLKREDKLGYDPIKNKMYEDYSKRRGNRVQHPEKRKEKLKELTSKPLELKIKIK